MTSLECHLCERAIEGAVMWLLPFTAGDYDGPNVIQGFGAVSSEPMDGSVPCCQPCLETLEKESQT